MDILVGSPGVQHTWGTLYLPFLMVLNTFTLVQLVLPTFVAIQKKLRL
jgi:hypothetical protein